MSVEQILKSIQQFIPECVAAGAVDIGSGLLLCYHALDRGTSGSLDPLVAATGELFMGENVVAIQDMLARIRKGDGASNESAENAEEFHEIVILSRRFFHIFQRCKEHTNVVMMTICNKTANIGMVMLKGRSKLELLDGALNKEFTGR